MFKFTQNIFNELCLNLDLLPSDTDPKEILRVLKVRMMKLIKYNEIISFPPFSDYHLIRKIQLD